MSDIKGREISSSLFDNLDFKSLIFFNSSIDDDKFSIT